MNDRHIALAITGASGSIYGLRICQELLKAGCRISMLISRAGFEVLREECQLDWSGAAAQVSVRVQSYLQAAPDRLAYYDEHDFLSPIASGSSAPEAMIVAPCSMGSLGRIAAGLSGNLLERAADVTIKEGRPLVLVPRETPLSAIHLENMLKLARLGVRIVPAMPGFYGAPQTIDDLVNFVVGKVLDVLDIPNSITPRWGDR